MNNITIKLTVEQQIQNRRLIDKVGNAEGIRPIKWDEAYEFAERNATALRDEGQASRLFRYIPNVQKADRTIRKAAKQYKFNEDEAGYAITLARRHLITPKDSHSAEDLLLQARAELAGQKGQYARWIAKSGNYPDPVAAEVEKRYLATGAPLSRTQMLQMLREEELFRSDIRAFVRESCDALIFTADIEGDAARKELDERMKLLATRLRQVLDGRAKLPAEVIPFSRDEQVRLLLTEYQGWLAPISGESLIRTAGAQKGLHPLLIDAAVAAAGGKELDKAEALSLLNKTRQELVTRSKKLVGAAAEDFVRADYSGKIMAEDIGVVGVLRDAWKVLNNEDLSPEDTIKMLADKPFGLLVYFRDEERQRTAKERVAAMEKRVNKMKEGSSLRSEKEAELKGWKAVLEMPGRLDALMQKIGELVLPDKYTMQAVTEMLGQIDKERLVLQTPEEAAKHLEAAMFRIEVSSRIRHRIERGLIPEDAGKAAIERLLGKKEMFPSADEEAYFFAAICAELNQPYPAKLVVHVLYADGQIPKAVYDAALEKIDSENLQLNSREEVSEFVKKVEAEVSKRLEEEKAREAAAAKAPKNGSRGTFLIPAAIGYALTVARPTDDSGPLRVRRLPQLWTAPGVGQPEARGGVPPAVPEASVAPAPPPAQPAPSVAPAVSLAAGVFYPHAAEPFPTPAPQPGHHVPAPPTESGETIHGHPLRRYDGIPVPPPPRPVPGEDFGTAATTQLPAPIVPPAAEEHLSPAEDAKDRADTVRVRPPAVEGPEDAIPLGAREAQVPILLRELKGQPGPFVLGSPLVPPLPDGKGWAAALNRELDAAPGGPASDTATPALVTDADIVVVSETAAGDSEPVGEIHPASITSEMERREVRKFFRGEGLPYPEPAAAEHATSPPEEQPAPVPEQVASAPTPAPEPTPASEPAPSAEAKPSAPVAKPASVAPARPPSAQLPGAEEVAEALGSPSVSASSPTLFAPPTPSLVAESLPDGARPTTISPPPEALIAASADETGDIVLAVRRLYHGKNTAVRLEAADFLASRSTPAALMGLAGALEYGGDIAQYSSALLISRGEDAVPAISTVLAEGSDVGRLIAISALRSIGSQKAFDALSHALQDDVPAIAQEAASHLLLAHAIGAADTDKHFLALPDERALLLLGKMLEEKYGTEEESGALRLQSARLLAQFASSGRSAQGAYKILCSVVGGSDPRITGIAIDSLVNGGSDAASHLEVALTRGSAIALVSLVSRGDDAVPGLSSVLESGKKPGKMAALSALVRIGSGNSYDAISRALADADAGVAEEAAFQLLLAHEKADVAEYFLSLPDEKALPLLRTMLLGKEYSSEEQARAMHLQSAKLLAEFAGAGRSGAYPVLCSAIGEAYPEVAKVVTDALREGGFSALPHLEGALLGGSEVVAGRAAVIFLSLKGEDDEVHYAYSNLLRAAAENSMLMGILATQASFERVCNVLHDENTALGARKSAAILVNMRDAQVALPHLLMAHVSQPDLREATFELLKGRDGTETLAVALSETKRLGGVYDSLISELVGEYGSRSTEYLANYAESESAKGGLNAEEARFLISRVPDGAPAPHAVRLLAPMLPLLGTMDDDQQVAVLKFAKRTGKDALPVLLEHAKSASAKGLGADTAHLLSVVVGDIGAKEGVEILKYVLPEVGGMNHIQLEKVRNLALNLDAARAEELLLEYVDQKARSGAIPVKEALALAKIAGEVGFTLNSGRCAALLSYMLPLLDSMDEKEAAATAKFAALPLLRDDSVGRVEAFLTGKAALTDKEAAGIALILASINTDASFADLTALLQETNLPKDRVVAIHNAAKRALSGAYGQEAVRDALVRAAFREKGPLSTLGEIAFEIISEKKDAGADVIAGCVDVHLCEAVADPEKLERLFKARQLLIECGDPAIGPLSAIAFSPDFPRYPQDYRINMLKTIAFIAERSVDEKTKKKAMECLLNAVGMDDLEERVVASALSVMKSGIVEELAAVLPPEPSEPLRKLEQRVCIIIREMGSVAQEQTGRMLSSEDEEKRRSGAALLRKLISQERDIPKALRTASGLQKNVDRLAWMLLDADGNVRTEAGKALDALGPSVPLAELEKVVRFQRESEEELLPLGVEMAARHTAAVLIAKAGERAVEHFSRIINDAAINDAVRREAVAASVSVGDKMLEAQVRDAGSRGIREKYMAVNAVLHSDSPFGESIRAMYLAQPDWHNAMLADDLDRGSQIPEWKKQVMKWVIVQGVVLHWRPEVADIAHSLCEYYRFLKPEELAGELREAIYSKARHDGLLPEEERALAIRSIELLSRTGLDTRLLGEEVLRSPARPAEDSVDRAKYLGFVRKASTPPPPPRRGDSGARKLVGPNGEKGGTQ